MTPQEQEVMLVNIPKLFQQRNAKMTEWEQEKYNGLISSYEKYGRLTDNMVNKILVKLFNIAQGQHANTK